MELLIFGHSGARLLVFPTSKGRYYEWEDRGMMNTLGDQISNGFLQVYCVDSVDAESWYARWKWPGDRAWRQLHHALTQLPRTRSLFTPAAGQHQMPHPPLGHQMPGHHFTMMLGENASQLASDLATLLKRTAQQKDIAVRRAAAGGQPSAR